MEITALMKALGRATTTSSLCIVLIFGFVIGGCGSPIAVPVRDQSGKSQKEPVRVVRHGETLYSIAWETGKDPNKLAQWNKIENIDRISAGQRLRLVPPARESESSPRTDVSENRKLNWVWPTVAEHVSGYDPRSGITGLEIAGKSGQKINSAASGQVVYAGEGLRGYGRLLIVKHNNEYLSAYAHNRRLLVEEGEWVDAGQTVAEMGSSGTDRVKLHFEIRKNGDPVDPGKFLPSN